jgi:hypothetical protein
MVESEANNRGSPIATWCTIDASTSDLVWKSKDDWPIYRDRLFQHIGNGIDFSPIIYSERSTMKLLEYRDRAFLEPVHDFALSRDKIMECERTIMSQQFELICELIKEKGTPITRETREDLERFFRAESGPRNQTSDDFKRLKDKYQSEIDDSEAVEKFWKLVECFLDAVNKGENFYDARSAWRRYIIKLLEPRIRVHEKKGPRPEGWDKEYNILRQVYWWLQILKLREGGMIGAWEGIRIVSDKP